MKCNVAQVSRGMRHYWSQMRKTPHNVGQSPKMICMSVCNQQNVRLAVTYHVYCREGLFCPITRMNPGINNNARPVNIEVTTVCTNLFGAPSHDELCVQCAEFTR